MNGFAITTDNMGDLPESFYKENEVGCAYLSYTMEGKQYSYPDFLPEKEFYDRIRGGAMPTTSQINPQQATDLMEPYLQEGRDILHIAFSSGLSGSCASAKLAAEMLKKKYPERMIIVIDSRSASLGQGLLLYYVVQMRKDGSSLEETAAWAEEHKLNVVHLFTVDSLFHLHRGGRVSKKAAVVGSMLSLKPMLHVDNEGKLIPTGKVRGRKKSLTGLADEMEEKLGSYASSCDTIFISHGDCKEDAEFLAEQIGKKHKLKTVLINCIGPVIGAHAGPGTVALFFLGDER